MRASLAFLVLLVPLLVADVASASHDPRDPERCHADKSIYVLSLGTPKCSNRDAGWLCYGGTGISLWTRGGFFLSLRAEGCKPRP